MTNPADRTASLSRPCPRCQGRLAEAAVQDAEVLDCAGCGGVFLPAPIVHRLGLPESHELRAAFPFRERAPEATEVRYVKCPICEQLMNRVDFARASRVIVDVCKNDGTWFDRGEVHAVIGFVERGGLELSQQRRQQELVAEKAKLRAKWRVEQQALAAASAWPRGGDAGPRLSDGERLLLKTLFGLGD